MSDDSLRKLDVFPDIEKAFFFSLKPIDEVKKSCLIVLDTNSLLLPFLSGSKSLQAIRSVFESLVDSDRLFVPAHVAREFLDNRAEKLKDIHDNLNKKMSANISLVGNQPLLEGIDSFSRVRDIESRLEELKKEHRDAIKETIIEVQGWGWDDPVSRMYHEVFKGRILPDEKVDREELLKELEYRNRSKIPPGYKDERKEENKAGDLIIWMEILALGKRLEKDLIFVSGDEKQDWWHQSSSKGLYPRVELVNEYREATQGKCFYIKSLSEVMSLFEADQDAVTEIKKSEREREVVSSKGSREIDEIYSLYKEAYSLSISIRDLSRKMESVVVSNLYQANEDGYLKRKLSEDEKIILEVYRKNFRNRAIKVKEAILSLEPIMFMIGRSEFTDELYEKAGSSVEFKEVSQHLAELARLLKTLLKNSRNEF